MPLGADDGIDHLVEGGQWLLDADDKASATYDGDARGLSELAYAEFAATAAAAQQVSSDVVSALDADGSSALGSTLGETLDQWDCFVDDFFGASEYGSVQSGLADRPFLAWWRPVPLQASEAVGHTAWFVAAAADSAVMADDVLPAPATNEATAVAGDAGEPIAIHDTLPDGLARAIFQNTGFELFLSDAELQLFVLRLDMLRAAGFDVPG